MYISFTGEKRVSSGHFVDFDLTSILKEAVKGNADGVVFSDTEKQGRLQLMLTTRANAWIKVASKEYPVVSQRPKIILEDETWSDTLEPVLNFLFTMYWWIITPLHPIICGVGLALIAHYSRKIILPFLIPLVINIVKSYQVTDVRACRESNLFLCHHLRSVPHSLFCHPFRFLTFSLFILTCATLSRTAGSKACSCI